MYYNINFLNFLNYYFNLFLDNLILYCLGETQSNIKLLE